MEGSGLIWKCSRKSFDLKDGGIPNMAVKTPINLIQIRKKMNEYQTDALAKTKRIFERIWCISGMNPD